ncbi:EamA family transporter [Streptacidiphilus jiangxiensis]|uniref:Inner membrane transporter RhtA n=1 Tax=Streptacidiphilus jiangxiensis TaxID=235985 RepID=A0A1H7J056_STRJI|nr:EamA family transporter [Streptacidiphilus jiangxiensis]SEK68109.1 inner membrane transporter RhtA [Streptacidiphilus jiangxiensis]
MTSTPSSSRTAPFEEHGGWSDASVRVGAPPPSPAGEGTEAQRRRSRIPAPLFCLAAMVTVQLGIALSTPLFPQLGVAGTTLLRLLTASAVLLLATRPRLRGRSARDLGAAALLGVASAGMTLTFASAVARLPMGTAATIEFLGPLAVALGFSRRLGHVLWALLAAAGVALLTLVGGGSGHVSASGLAFAFGAAVCLGLYILLTQQVGTAFSGFEGLALSLTVAAIVLVPFGAAQAWHGVSTSAHPWAPLLSAAGVAMLFPLAPYLLEMTALRRMPQRVFSVIASLEPAVSALVGLTVLGQVLSPVQLAGIACVVAASAGATFFDKR